LREKIGCLRDRTARKHSLPEIPVYEDDWQAEEVAVEEEIERNFKHGLMG
jgi:hypothetical protein